mmetsp:Transcript_1241/g.4607  ORF Transcript_1241/g.4607 Transcript_1241/m.4607 type:complete len:203 (-) Transcript_1241:10-618(-)
MPAGAALLRHQGGVLQAGADRGPARRGCRSLTRRTLRALCRQPVLCKGLQSHRRVLPAKLWLRRAGRGGAFRVPGSAGDRDASLANLTDRQAQHIEMPRGDGFTDGCTLAWRPLRKPRRRRACAQPRSGASRTRQQRRRRPGRAARRAPTLGCSEGQAPLLSPLASPLPNGSAPSALCRAGQALHRRAKERCPPTRAREASP